MKVKSCSAEISDWIPRRYDPFVLDKNYNGQYLNCWIRNIMFVSYSVAVISLYEMPNSQDYTVYFWNDLKKFDSIFISLFGRTITKSNPQEAQSFVDAFIIRMEGLVAFE